MAAGCIDSESKFGDAAGHRSRTVPPWPLGYSVIAEFLGQGGTFEEGNLLPVTVGVGAALEQGNLLLGFPLTPA